MQPTQNPNTSPNPDVPVPEQPGVPVVERQPQPVAPEVAPVAPPGAPAGQVPVQLPQIPNVPDPAIPTVADPAAAPSAPAIGKNPIVADDADVIEKEWVDQANHIVKQTQNDPYLQEEAVESLQIDYLKKRYGHDVTKPEGTQAQ